MTKHLIFYWYVKPDGWSNIYDLHLQNFLLYKDVFDKVTLVISTDDNIDNELIKLTKEKLLNIFNNAEIIDFKNDKKLGETAYFHYEVMEKLNNFNNDEAIFFAHSKGCFTNYTTKEDIIDWINCMYFANLENMDKINDLLSKEETITIGSCCVKDYKVGAFAPCKYGWHYQGTFFWFVPSRLIEYLNKHNEQLPPIGRYYTEMLFGTIFPFDSKHCVKLYGTKGVHEKYKNYIKKNFTEQNKIDFNKATLQVQSTNNIDIFVFSHKNFETDRTNPVYKIVCNKNDNVSSDSLEVIKLDCELSNIGFSEWQKIYELYKQKQVELNDYVGLAHYHRFLSFGGDVNYVPEMNQFFEKYDVLDKHPINVGNLRKQYGACHNVNDFDLAFDILKEMHSELNDKIDKVVNDGVMFDSNIMILRKNDFISLCDFVFPVLFEYCNHVGIDRTSDESFFEYKNKHIMDYMKIHKQGDYNFDEQARICSFIAERLVAVFLFTKFSNICILPMVEK